GDAIEDLGDRAGASADLAAQRIRLALQPPPALGPARMRLAVAAGVAGVLLHALAQVGDPALAPVALGPAVVRGPGVLLLEVGELATDAGVLREVAQVAAHRLGISGEGGLLLAHPARQVDHR